MPGQTKAIDPGRAFRLLHYQGESMSIYLNYEQVKAKVTIWYNKNPSQRKNAKIKQARGWTLKKTSEGWLSTNISEELFIVNDNNFIAWTESKRGKA